MRATWLADVLRASGCTVVPLDGWETRGAPLSQLDAVILHHTATSATASDTNVARLLRDGRADLPGPLSQLGLDRKGRFWLVAAGKCNHNGYGMHANQTVGIEAFNNGTGEPWPAVQLDAWVSGTAAIVKHLGLSVNRVLGHRESDPTRKVDPRGVDLDEFRRRVAALLGGSRPPLPPPTTSNYPEANVQRVDLQIDTDSEGRGYRDITASPREVVSVIANTANPPTAGYKPIPDVARLDVDGRTRIVVEEAVPNGRIDVSVWFAV